MSNIDETKKRVRAQYGESKKILNGNYDKSLAFMKLITTRKAPARMRAPTKRARFSFRANHGGAFEMGGTADPLYECSNFVKENPDAQNLGLMDQMAALKWIRI